jgi:putative aminopeptidase FrvX
MIFEHRAVLFDAITALVMCHSPSGREQEINDYLRDRLQALGVDHWQDEADNIIVHIPGKQNTGAIAITAHKDEIGGIVKGICPQGRVDVRAAGGILSLGVWGRGGGFAGRSRDH